MEEEPSGWDSWPYEKSRRAASSPCARQVGTQPRDDVSSQEGALTPIWAFQPPQL